MAKGIVIEYTFKIILAIIVILVFTMIIYYFKNNIMSYFKSEKEAKTVLIKNASIYDLEFYIVSCYRKKEKGTCYIVRISEYEKETPCELYVDYIREKYPDIIIKSCDFIIEPGDMIKINFDGKAVYLSKTI